MCLCIDRHEAPYLDRLCDPTGPGACERPCRRQLTVRAKRRDWRTRRGLALAILVYVSISLSAHSHRSKINRVDIHKLFHFEPINDN